MCWRPCNYLRRGVEIRSVWKWEYIAGRSFAELGIRGAAAAVAIAAVVFVVVVLSRGRWVDGRYWNAE